MPNPIQWRKSQRCHANNTCVEVAESGGFVLARDAKDPAGPWLRFDRAEWRRFVAGVKAP